MSKPIRICGVEDCGRKHYGHGFCHMHFRRWKKHGSPHVVKRVYRGPDVCIVDGCGRTGALKRGWCSTHYQRWERNGDPLALPGRVYLSGEDHYAWTESPAYRTVHSRLDRQYGFASKHPCAICSEPAVQWSYDHADPDELIGEIKPGVTVPYSANLDHYRPLCHPCHRRVDLYWLPVVA